jgi:hypothetical protein
MMSLVEQDSRRRVGPAARGIDHHQGMVGDHQVGFATRPLGAFDETAPVMRAAGIDAFAPPVGQRRGAGPAEQARQPPRQIAADHVPVARIGGPSPGKMGEDRGAASESALHRVLEVEEAEIILAALADDDRFARSFGVGTMPRPSASSWRCSALVKVDTQTVPPARSAHSEAGAR